MRIEQLSSKRWRVFAMIDQPNIELIFNSFEDIDAWAADIQKKVERMRADKTFGVTNRILVQFFLDDTPANQVLIKGLNDASVDVEQIIAALQSTLPKGD